VFGALEFFGIAAAALSSHHSDASANAGDAARVLRGVCRRACSRAGLHFVPPRTRRLFPSSASGLARNRHHVEQPFDPNSPPNPFSIEFVPTVEGSVKVLGADDGVASTG